MFFSTYYLIIPQGISKVLKVLKGNSRLFNNVTRGIKPCLLKIFLDFNCTLTSAAAGSIYRYLGSEGGADHDLLGNFRVFHGSKEPEKFKVVKIIRKKEYEKLVSNLIYYLNNCVSREALICSDKTFSVDLLFRTKSRLLKCSISLRCIERFDGHAEVYEVLKECVP